MKANCDLSAVKKKDLEKLVDEKIRTENNFFIINIFKKIRKLKEKDLYNNIVMYPKNDFKKMDWKDRTIARVVARYKDIMLNIEFFNKYDSNLLSKNITILSKVIQKVALRVDLDRVVYVRIFKKGDVDLEKGYILQKGYCDRLREFNEDILDILTISLEEIADKDNEIGELIQYLC